MSGILEIEYRGLNIFDEIGVVEIAIDNDSNVIHLYDQNQVVPPEYDFSTKSYVVNDSFINMTKVLNNKYFFSNNHDKNVNEWVEGITWIFYLPGKVFKFENGEVKKILEIHNVENLYEKYVLRIL